MNANHNTQQTRAEFIMHLMPTLDQRYANLRGLLAKAEQGEPVNDADLWLAHSDLSAVVDLMIESEEEEEFC